MGRARARIDLPVRVGSAEALWYDTTRWPSFVDGFKAVAKVEGDWPRAGSRLVWDSVPTGRGRVVERVTRHEVRSGQVAEVEDERIVGTQTLTFTPESSAACRVELELRWQLKERHALTPVVDLLFVRRAFSDALRRTLSRFAREVRAEVELH